jgi:putative ABC transport system ATP-binding protein
LVPAVECTDVGKVFQAAVPIVALNGVSLRVMPGEMVCLVGRSGSGKSTLLSLLGLLDSPTSGSIQIDGQTTSTLDRRELGVVRANKLGFVFQAFNLVPELPASANVALALRYRGGRHGAVKGAVEAALERVGLTHRLHSRVSTMSGGEQQRVAVARALVKAPAIVLADEPTGNLDSENERLIIDLLRDAADEGTTVIIATHSTEVSNQADRSYCLFDGHLTGTDEP